MTATLVSPRATASDTGSAGRQWDDDLTHLVCTCDDLLAWCGMRLEQDAPWSDTAEGLCPLCMLASCPSCGVVVPSGWFD